jgi:hypothetical protein
MANHDKLQTLSGFPTPSPPLGSRVDRSDNHEDRAGCPAGAVLRGCRDGSTCWARLRSQSRPSKTDTIFGSARFNEPGGPMNLQLGAGLTAAWMLAFALWRDFRGRQQNPV